ncbi:MAG: CDP-alcohol phosphatidyltransferase family protein [Hyphomicrobiaceae bacterium]|nr:CDP-alcohol phosphatidyltransferase family protein [Hyphomicrobiaceae bacterium]
MLDGLIRRRLDPVLDRLGRALAARGIGADVVTIAGLALAIAAAIAIAAGAPAAALVLMLASRLADGLDGAVARATVRTDFGGLLDIVCDFVFYAAIPLGFALNDPAGNAVAAAVLLTAFYVNGASFLGFAVMAAKRGLETTARGPKSLYFTTGLAEGSETIATFAAMLLAPAWFPPLAYGFAALCLATTLARMALAWRLFR